MADYRNVAFQLKQGSLNVGAPPEQIPEIDLTRSLNLRSNSEGLIEARPTKKEFDFTQKALNGYPAVYPDLWSTGPLRAIRYIGEITVNSDTHVKGYLTVHDSTPLPLGKADSTYRVFVNGAPVLKKTGYATYAPLDPTSVSNCAHVCAQLTPDDHCRWPVVLLAERLRPRHPAHYGYH
jgi:hypothetical protein